MQQLRELEVAVAFLCTDLNSFLLPFYEKYGFQAMKKPYTFVSKSGRKYTESNGMLAPIVSQKHLIKLWEVRPSLILVLELVGSLFQTPNQLLLLRKHFLECLSNSDFVFWLFAPSSILQIAERTVWAKHHWSSRWGSCDATQLLVWQF